MRISNGTRINEIGEHNGYGYASVNMLSSLSRLGYEVNRNDPTADVEIWFDQPQYWKFSPGVYKIGYHPWESTRLPVKRDRCSGNTDWVAKMNKCDEIWTPSALIAEWYVGAGITVPIYVYEHGVDPVWAAKRREHDGMFKFLHVGAEAARKGAGDTMKAFRVAFGAQRGKDVELTMKIISNGWNIGRLPGIQILNENISVPDLVQLYHEHHVFVYPSWGEGFGLTPLQAIATGMPTIIPSAWAPYRRFVQPELDISSKLWKSPWPLIHPGNMLKPDFDDLVDHMRYAYENYDSTVDFHMGQVDAVAQAYSWDSITKQVFEDLEKRLKNS